MEMEKRTTRPSTRTPSRGTKSASLANGRKEKREVVVSSEQRYRMICDAAYFLAEKRGFQNGTPEQDWLKAEKQIDTLLTRIDDLMKR